MSGITRIQIVSDWDDWRTQMSKALAPIADNLYRQVFLNLGLVLSPDVHIVECSKDEARARYDWQEGIDVLLEFQRGGKATLQEKFLTYKNSTLTFEERKTSNEDGAWYSCTAQYYFVGYDREYKDKDKLQFDDWMLIDLPLFRRLDGEGKIPWAYNQNHHDGRRATFRYVTFNRVPAQCVVARHLVVTESRIVQLGFL